MLTKQAPIDASFDGEDLIELAEHLSIESYEEAAEVAKRLIWDLYRYRFEDQKRRHAGKDLRGVQRRMQGIASAALRLMQKLAAEPNAAYLVSIPVVDEDGLGYVSKNLEVEAKELDEFFHHLEEVWRKADFLSKNEKLLRAMHGAPQAEDMNTPSESLYLWPRLFRTWEDHERRVVQTAEGSPLHRFICFVHRVAGLAEPSAKNVRRAAIRWRREEGRRALYTFPRRKVRPASQ